MFPNARPTAPIAIALYTVWLLTGGLGTPTVRPDRRFSAQLHALKINDRMSMPVVSDPDAPTSHQPSAHGSRTVCRRGCNS